MKRLRNGNKKHPPGFGGVIILGAGASKGASFSDNKGVTPPLDGDFFVHAHAIFERKGRAHTELRSAKSDWKKFKVAVQRAGINPSKLKNWKLETLTTYLEARSNVRFEAKAGKPAKYREALRLLNIIVCHVLSHSNGCRKCDLHEYIFRKLKPKAIISFNYDLIADQSILSLDDLKWSDRVYSYSNNARLGRSSQSRRWFQGKRRPSTKGALLLKLHGSIHWNRLQRGEGFQIAGVASFPPRKKSETLEYLAPPTTPFIVPPVAAKMEIPESALHAVWSKASRELRRSSQWVLWGYSFPQTDTITTVLLKTAVKSSRGTKKRLLIINPDPFVGDRTKKSLEKVHIEQFSSIERFLHEIDLLPIPTSDVSSKKSNMNKRKIK